MILPCVTREFNGVHLTLTNLESIQILQSLIPNKHYAEAPSADIWFKQQSVLQSNSPSAKKDRNRYLDEWLIWWWQLSWSWELLYAQRCLLGYLLLHSHIVDRVTKLWSNLNTYMLMEVTRPYNTSNTRLLHLIIAKGFNFQTKY